ncbi:MAG: 16S rRNA (uracil(1498)-N(3))-methyltransferase [Candidatus Magasanikbacteria bacterium]
MKRFIGQFNLKKNQLNIESERIYHHAVNVLRMKKGDQFVLGDGRGNVSEATIRKIGDNFIRVGIENMKRSSREQDINLTLYCSILKSGNFDWVVRKCTEIGVTRIVPFVSERTVKTGLKYDRLRKIALQAAEQSKRGVLPQVEEKISLDSFDNFEAFDQLLVPYVGAQKKLNSFISSLKKESLSKVGVFVGPEGGFTEDEVEFLENYGADCVGLGSFVLRSETAAVVSSFSVING